MFVCLWAISSICVVSACMGISAICYFWGVFLSVFYACIGVMLVTGVDDSYIYACDVLTVVQTTGKVLGRTYL